MKWDKIRHVIIHSKYLGQQIQNTIYIIYTNNFDGRKSSLPCLLSTMDSLMVSQSILSKQACSLPYIFLPNIQKSQKTMKTALMDCVLHNNYVNKDLNRDYRVRYTTYHTRTKANPLRWKQIIKTFLNHVILKCNQLGSQDVI